MNCEHFKKMESKLASKEVSLLGKLSMYYHMIICPPCKVYLYTIKKADEILKLYFPKKMKTLKPEEKENMKEKLKKAFKTNQNLQQIPVYKPR